VFAWLASWSATRSKREARSRVCLLRVFFHCAGLNLARFSTTELLFKEYRDMNAQVQAPSDGAFGLRTNKDFFWYAPNAAASVSSVAPNATQNIQIDADADFYWVATTYQIDILAATLTEATNIIPLVTLQIVDTGAGKYLSNVGIPLAAFAGDGKRPYRLIRPRLFGANSTIQLNWTSYVAAGTTYNIRFVMHGYKQYTR